MADLIRLLSHDDDIIVQDGIATIFNLLFAGASKDTLRAPHPLFDEMQRIGGINQFAKIFRSGTPKAKCISAMFIARLYRGKKMDNTQLNKQIIEQVMDLSEKKPDHWAYKAAQLVMEEIEAL
ncbi:MAG: hypothetical protein EZS28_024609 [Streblomastix strix]|uniref:Uncharacterized protein n=1 Tax=Streblomastix strix TaxID=222440 RepID=A0A5J4VBM4_9EUKA|nr:MAG: hypothetical protein EZS28_024609 [Streblomastix strix]